MNPVDKFRKLSRQAIANPFLQTALDNNAARRQGAWGPAFASLPDVDESRRQARLIRQEVVENLESYLARFIEQVETNGFVVHRASDAEEATGIILELAHQYGAGLVAKSKSMVTEEIGLNHALEGEGIRVVETDLGEFIVQLRGEAPTHIIAPAVHLRREDVAETFERELGMPYTTDVVVMNTTAHDHLREVFLSADIGFSGVNFGVVDNGALCLVTNEGNGRMVTTVPPVHIAVMGAERLVPTLDDLALMLQLLPRSATGQKISSYVNLMRTPRQEGDPDGPEARHLVIVDNGRLAMAGTSLEESLLCIRCGACLNACPVYQEIGGKAYGSVYPGPIGSVISAGLFGIEEYGHLAKASTLCGACMEACPVSVDFPTLLLRVRDEYVQAVPQPFGMRMGVRFYAWVMGSPGRYRWAQRLAALGTRILPGQAGWVRALPPPFSGWTRARHFPRFAGRSFRERWGELEAVRDDLLGDDPMGDDKTGYEYAGDDPPGCLYRESSVDLAGQFEIELEALGGELVRCGEGKLMDLAATRLRELNVKSLIAWEGDDSILGSLVESLRREGFEFLPVELPARDGEARRAQIFSMGGAGAGLTGAVAGLADTGTLALPGGPGRSQLASLLPPVHLAVLRAQDIYPSMGAWLAAGGKALIESSPNLALVSGPSRTADIEMTLTIGVHGPAKLIVFCVE